MRFIKAFFVGATGLFIIITLFSLLIPSNVRVSRAVLINNAGAEEVYKLVANVDNWKKWHPLFTKDSATLKKYNTSGSDWIIVHRGKEVTVKITAADTTSVKFLLLSEGENTIENDLVIMPLAGQQAVQIEWRSITKLHWYPWDKFYGIFIDKLTGPGYEAALDGLNTFLEKS